MPRKVNTKGKKSVEEIEDEDLIDEELDLDDEDFDDFEDEEEEEVKPAKKTVKKASKKEEIEDDDDFDDDFEGEEEVDDDFDEDFEDDDEEEEEVKPAKKTVKKASKKEEIEEDEDDDDEDFEDDDDEDFEDEDDDEEEEEEVKPAKKTVKKASKKEEIEEEDDDEDFEDEDDDEEEEEEVKPAKKTVKKASKKEETKSTKKTDSAKTSKSSSKTKDSKKKTESKKMTSSDVYDYIAERVETNKKGQAITSVNISPKYEGTILSEELINNEDFCSAVNQIFEIMNDEGIDDISEAQSIPVQAATNLRNAIVASWINIFKAGGGFVLHKDEDHAWTLQAHYTPEKVWDNLASSNKPVSKVGSYLKLIAKSPAPDNVKTLGKMKDGKFVALKSSTSKSSKKSK